jgi:hypothetical protein
MYVDGTFGLELAVDNPYPARFHPIAPWFFWSSWYWSYVHMLSEYTVAQSSFWVGFTTYAVFSPGFLPHLFC